MVSARLAAGFFALAVPLVLVTLVAVAEPAILRDRVFVTWFIAVPVLLAAVAVRWHLVGGVLMGALGTYGLGVVGILGDLALLSLFVFAFLGAGFLHVLLGISGLYRPQRRRT